jgi:hypothetical protein
MTDVLDERKKKNSLIFECIACKNVKNKENLSLSLRQEGEVFWKWEVGKLGRWEVGEF